jgi:hypothetical protein
MLRLTRLFNWSNDPIASQEVPPLIFGPFYTTIRWFEDAPLGTVPWTVDWTNYVWQPREALATHPIARATAWRLSMLWYYINNHSLLSTCFPLTQREDVLPMLLCLVDAMHPLVFYLDTCTTTPTLLELVVGRLLPEQRREQVIDHTWFEDILRLFIPTIFTGPAQKEWLIPDALFRTLGLNPANADDDRSLRFFYGLLRRTLFRKTGLRSFLPLLHEALSIQSPAWLSRTLVVMFKCVLLGAYPGARDCMGWVDRHQVYQWKWEDLLCYFRGTVRDARASDKDVDTRVAMAILVQAIGCFLAPGAPTQRSCRQFLAGWDAFKAANDHLLQVILRVFPNPPDHASVNMSYREVPVLSLRFADIIYALGSKGKPATGDTWATLCHLDVDWAQVTTLTDLVQLLVECNPYHGSGDVLTLHRLQRLFRRHSTLGALESELLRLSPGCRTRLLSLCSWIVQRRIFRVTAVNHLLALQQHHRLLEVDPGLRPHDAYNVIHCRECGTVRFKPVGSTMPSSYVTLQVRMAWMEISCMKCDSSDLEVVNVLGSGVRCLLDTKNKPGVQHLVVCSACQHIMNFASDYVVDGSPVCIECYVGTVGLLAVAAATPTVCINGCNLPLRHQVRLQRFFVVDQHQRLVPVAICTTCMPLDLKSCANTVTRYSRRELEQATQFRLQSNARQQYTTRPKYTKKRKIP